MTDPAINAFWARQGQPEGDRPRCTWLVPDRDARQPDDQPEIECGEPARWLAYAPPGVAVGPQWHPTCDGHREHPQMVGWQLFPLIPTGPDVVEAVIYCGESGRFGSPDCQRPDGHSGLHEAEDASGVYRWGLSARKSDREDDATTDHLRRIVARRRDELADQAEGFRQTLAPSGSGDYVVDADGDEQPRTHPTDVSTAAPGAVCGAWHTEHPEQPCDREPHHDPDDWHSHTGGMSWRDPEHTVTSRDYQRAFPPFTAPRGPVKFRAELTAGDVQQVLYKYARQHGADSRQAHDLSRHLEQQAADPLGTIDTEVRNAQARMAMADASWLDLADVLSLHPDVEADDVWETKADIVEFVRGLVLADCEILDHDGGVTITDVDLDAAIETWLGQAGMAPGVAEQVAGQLVHLITGCVNVSASESSDLDTVMYRALRYHLGENELTEQVSGALWLLGAQGRLVQQGATMRWGGGGGREGQTSLIPAATTTVPPGTPFAVVVTRAELPL